jgi:hypothetical protein
MYMQSPEFKLHYCQKKSFITYLPFIIVLSTLSFPFRAFITDCWGLMSVLWVCIFSSPYDFHLLAFVPLLWDISYTSYQDYFQNQLSFLPVYVLKVSMRMLCSLDLDLELSLVFFFSLIIVLESFSYCCLTSPSESSYIPFPWGPACHTLLYSFVLVLYLWLK